MIFLFAFCLRYFQLAHLNSFILDGNSLVGMQTTSNGVHTNYGRLQIWYWRVIFNIDLIIWLQLWLKWPQNNQTLQLPFPSTEMFVTCAQQDKDRVATGWQHGFSLAGRLKFVASSPPCFSLSPACDSERLECLWFDISEHWSQGYGWAGVGWLCGAVCQACTDCTKLPASSRSEVSSSKKQFPCDGGSEREAETTRERDRDGSV